jgi:Protein of unknown function (DUF3298)
MNTIKHLLWGLFLFSTVSAQTDTLRYRVVPHSGVYGQTRNHEPAFSVGRTWLVLDSTQLGPALAQQLRQGPDSTWLRTITPHKQSGYQLAVEQFGAELVGVYLSDSVQANWQPFEYQDTVQVLFNQRNLACLFHSEYSSGGMHPVYANHTVLLDLRTRQVLGLAQLIDLDTYGPKLRRMLLDSLCDWAHEQLEVLGEPHLGRCTIEYLEEQGFWLDDDAEALFSTVQLVFDGRTLAFYYNFYSIAPYVMGTFQFTFTLAQLKPLLRLGTALHNFAR